MQLWISHRDGEQEPSWPCRTCCSASWGGSMQVRLPDRACAQSATRARRGVAESATAGSGVALDDGALDACDFVELGLCLGQGLAQPRVLVDFGLQTPIGRGAALPLGTRRVGLHAIVLRLQDEPLL